MGYSAAAISQQLSTLERETGVVLLERTARSATLTDAGRLLARHAAGLLSDAERAESELAAQAGMIGGQPVVCTISSMAATVAGAVAAVQQRYPAVEILMRQIAALEAAEAIVSRLSDIAIVDEWSGIRSSPMAGLTRDHIHTEEVVLAVPAAHPLAADRGRLTAHRFRQAASTMTWLCAPEGHPSRLAGDRRLGDCRARPARRWEFEGLATIAQLVTTGTGCALLPESVTRTQPAAQLAGRKLTPAMLRHIHAFTRTSTKANPTMAVCLAAITERVRDQAGESA